MVEMHMIAVREEHDDPHLQHPIQPQRRMGRHWPVKSGKAMARTGLRMMPTFPSPPLKVGSRSGAVSLRFSLPGAPRFLWDWTH